MSATHQVTVLSIAGASATLEVRIVHSDENHLWLLKTAMLSMLNASLDEAHRKVADSVREAFDEAGGDEPDTTASASQILKKVDLLKVVRGTVASRSKKRLAFDRREEPAGAEPVVRLKLTTTGSRYLAHLRKGSTWATAPLFPELSGESSGPEPRLRARNAPARKTPVAAPTRRSAILADEVIYLGQHFRFGAAVCIAQRAGTFKSAQTGGPEVDAVPPASGTLLGIDDAWRREKGEARYVARVRWHAQAWKTWPEQKTVELAAFETTTHLDYLAVST